MSAPDPAREVRQRDERIAALEAGLDTIRRWFLNPGDPDYDAATQPPLEPRPEQIARDLLERP